MEKIRIVQNTSFMLVSHHALVLQAIQEKLIEYSFSLASLEYFSMMGFQSEKAVQNPKFLKFKLGFKVSEEQKKVFKKLEMISNFRYD